MERFGPVVTPAAPRSARAIAETLIIGVAGAASCTVYGEFFAGRDYLAGLVVGAVLGAVAGWLAGGLRSLILTAVLSVGGFAGLAVWGPYRSTLHGVVPTQRTWQALTAGLEHGWGNLMSAGLPADASPELVVLPLLLVWLAAFAAALLARWSTSVLAPCLPLVAGFALGLLVGSAHGQHHVQGSVGFLAALALLTVVRARTGRRPLAAVPVVVGLLAVAVLGQILLRPATAATGFDPRRYYDPPIRISEAITPLSTVKPQLKTTPPVPLFAVRVLSGAPIDRIRVATLQYYDGNTWTTGDLFPRAGRVLEPLSVPATVGSSRATIEVSLGRLKGPFLPVVGRPRELISSGTLTGIFGFSRDSGSLVVDGDPPIGITYRLTADLPARSALALARPAAEKASVATMPDRMRTETLRIAGLATTPVEQLAVLEKALRSKPYDIDSPPGHSWAALQRLTAGTDDDDIRAYAEQHAAAFAIMTRALGYSARVSVGYFLHGDIGQTQTVTTADVHAWPEVFFPGIGWVAYEPTDPSRKHPGTQRLPPPPAAKQSSSPVKPTPEPMLPRPDTTPITPPTWTVARIAAFAGLAALAVVVALLTTVVVAKTVRRRRRKHAPTTSSRVLGAWDDVRDRLLEFGYEPPRSGTAREIAASASRRNVPGGADVHRLADLSTVVLYGRAEPSEAQADAAWDLNHTIRRQISPGPRNLARRTRAAFDPRPLVLTAPPRKDAS